MKTYSGGLPFPNELKIELVREKLGTPPYYVYDGLNIFRETIENRSVYITECIDRVLKVKAFVGGLFSLEGCERDELDVKIKLIDESGVLVSEFTPESIVPVWREYVNGVLHTFYNVGSEMMIPFNIGEGKVEIIIDGKKVKELLFANSISYFYKRMGIVFWRPEGDVCETPDDVYLHLTGMLEMFYDEIFYPIQLKKDGEVLVTITWEDFF